MNDFILGDITPIRLGAGSVCYLRNGATHMVSVTSATIFDAVVVVDDISTSGTTVRMTFPLANLVEHIAKR